MRASVPGMLPLVGRVHINELEIFAGQVGVELAGARSHPAWLARGRSPGLAASTVIASAGLGASRPSVSGRLSASVASTLAAASAATASGATGRLSGAGQDQARGRVSTLASAGEAAPRVLLRRSARRPILRRQRRLQHQRAQPPRRRRCSIGKWSHPPNHWGCSPRSRQGPRRDQS